MDYRVRIAFKGPLHIGYMDGVNELSESLIHADTIFGALMSAHAKLFGDEQTKELIEKLKNNSTETELRISSAFYFVGETYFLPRPKSETFGLEKKVSQMKKLKKIKYVQDEILYGNVEVEESDIQGQFLSKRSIEFQGDFDGPVMIFERPRVMIYRTNLRSNLYYFSEVHFAPNCGLWFYLSVGQAIEKPILAALKLLADEGLGGDRTYGFGHFQYELEPVELPKEGEKYVLLSPYIPGPDDYDENQTIKDIVEAYELRYRTGYIHESDKKSKRVVMFSEGSVFNKRVDGKILNVTPDGFKLEKDYEIYRYGKAFLLPFRGVNKS